MTYELICYLFVFIMAVILLSIKMNYRIKEIVILITCFIYIITVRYSGFDIDINNYARILDYESLNNLYYLKEPVYWLSSHFLYHMFGYPKEINFIIYDIFSFFLYFIALKNFRINVSYLLILILFFPIMMGFQNVYRQYLSISILFYSISLIYDRKEFKGFVFFVLAGLTHNAAFLFLPLLFLFGNKRMLCFISLFFVCILIPFVLNTKSSDSSGLSLGFLYITIVSMLSILLLYVISFFKKNDKNSKYFIDYLLIINVILCVSILFMGSSQGERIGMYSLVMMFPVLIITIESCFKNKIIMRLLLCFFMIAPTFLFSSAYDFLLTTIYK